MKNKIRRASLTTLLILSASTIVFSQAVNKPSIMVFPDDVWMNENGYMTETDNQGVKVRVPDYSKALLNVALGQVITKIEGLMKDRGYPLTNLSQTLKSIADANALKSMEMSEEGAGVAEGPKDKLLSTARPDIILYITWSINSIGPKKSVTFGLSGMDAGSNKPAGSASGTGNELIGATLPAMLETAVLSHMDNFNAQLMAYFDDMVAKGREISVDIQVFDNSPKKLNTEINDDGDELSDDIKKWMKTNTVNGSFALQAKTPTMMQFVGVRIPLRGEDGAAYTNDDFGAKLRKYLKKTYQLPCASGIIGTGKAVITIGGKSQ